MENKKATIKRTGIGCYEMEIKIKEGTTYIVSDLNGELKIEEKDEK